MSQAPPPPPPPRATPPPPVGPPPSGPLAGLRRWWAGLTTGSKIASVIGVVILLLAIVGAATGGTTSGSTGGSGDAIEAYVVCQQYVEPQLKAPSTADWPPLSDVTVNANGSGTYVMNGYVDAENGFGAHVRAFWSCTATRQSDGDWLVSSVNVRG